MEPEDSLPTKFAVIGFRLHPVQAVPYPHTLTFKMHFILLLYLRLGLATQLSSHVSRCDVLLVCFTLRMASSSQPSILWSCFVKGTKTILPVRYVA